MLKICGRLRFEGCDKIPDEEFSSFFEQHRVPEEDYVKLRANWKNHRGHSIAWKFTLLEAFQTPRWIPWRQDTC